MPKIEYAFITFTPKPFNGHQVIVNWPDGKETKEDKSPAQVLTRMAAQSWEVVAMTGGHPIIYWTLRRES